MRNKGNLIDQPRWLELMSCDNEDAFRKVYSWYYYQVYDYAMLFTQCTAAADDITQDVFTKVWKIRSRLSHIENFRSYLLTWTRNFCINDIRKAKREQLLKEEYAKLRDYHDTGTESVMLKKEYTNLYKEAVRNLPPKRQFVFRLLEEEDITYTEIAEGLQLSINTVRNHRAKGNECIRSFLIEKLRMKNNSVLRRFGIVETVYSKHNPNKFSCEKI